MQPEYKVKSVLICDDIRREMSGKDIVIGLYNDVIVSRKIPLTLARLMFRVHIEGYGKKYSTFNLNVQDSGGSNIFEVSGKLNMADADIPIILIAQHENITFTKADTFSINVGLDRPAEKVWEFVTRLPKDSEQGRFELR